MIYQFMSYKGLGCLTSTGVDSAFWWTVLSTELYGSLF